MRSRSSSLMATSDAQVEGTTEQHHFGDTKILFFFGFAVWYQILAWLKTFFKSKIQKIWHFKNRPQHNSYLGGLQNQAFFEKHQNILAKISANITATNSFQILKDLNNIPQFLPNIQWQCLKQKRYSSSFSALGEKPIF